ncbi:MAG: hypothetical protein SGILL_006420, partial [Bacillariaceae sp.]
EILIAFMPHLKGDNSEASSIHELYQSNNDQKAFLLAARQFLSKERSKPSGSSTAPNAASGTRSQPTHSAEAPIPTPATTTNATTDNAVNATTTAASQGSSTGHNANAMQGNGTLPQSLLQHQNQQGLRHLQEGEASPGMEQLQRNMAGLLADDDDVISMPVSLPNISAGPTIGHSSHGPTPNSTFESLFPSSNPMPQTLQPPGMQQQQQHLHQPPQQQQQRQQQLSPNPFQQPSNPSNGLPHMSPNMSMSATPNQQGPDYASSRFSSLFASGNSQNNNASVSLFPQTQSTPIQSGSGPGWPTPQQAPRNTQRSPLPPGLPGHSQFSQNPSGNPHSASTMHTPNRTSTPAAETPPQLSILPEATPAKPVKKEYQPKRLWTHLEDQPGKILANNSAAALGTVVPLRPRQELTARWMLPVSYLRERAQTQGRHVRSVRDLLKNLSVGLFRRGCTENGSQASIVSKEILAPRGESRNDYPFQVTQDTVVGTIPFYSPRTPGHVVFRMYWDDEPLYTLATGPTLNVRITENDFESTIRFILSNFKGKKQNPTSLSSLNSLSLVLDQFHVHAKPGQAAQPHLDSAGRAVWGCICEARKVLDACSIDYRKTTARLEKLEVSVEELKEAVAAEEEKSTDTTDDATEKSIKSGDGELSVNATLLREKTKMLMSGKASCERKWRDSQLAFASILKIIVMNPSVGLLLRRELITKLRLEYELWCPLCEEFAVPGDGENQMWYEPINRMPQPITTDHFRVCTEARSKMQIRILGFDPNSGRLENILYPSRGRSREMNPVAVNMFNQLSSSMGQLYQEFYFTADRIIQQREKIREQTERLVNMCDCFPPGTKVAIFGSSANGFGSPKSDLDMCLQIPSGTSIVNEDDPTGAIAMATLSKVFEEHGMEDVDTARLTARIPVLKFNCSRGIESELLPEEELLMECDLSMNNPLAVLNTSLLRTYAEINPVSRVMASVIKRWAKARDINNPARHTLSSYGYILMLLHFLTYHQRSGNGCVSTLTRSSQNPPLPLLPNLQWMLDRWPQSPPGSAYTEYREPPKVKMQHPFEESVKVNAYFYRPNTDMMKNLQRLFPGQDLSLAILLASFFRYYAYEFDYKRHVVSLNSTLSYGVVEREVKAELDGWRNYSAALTIEDPFETFYDVAHVLRGGYYHRIRREFAVAYSKIADIASGKTSGTWNNKTVDYTKMSGMALIDWICEPVETAVKEETGPDGATAAAADNKKSRTSA